MLGLTVTDDSPSVNVTTAEYDTVGNLVAVTSPDAGTPRVAVLPGRIRVRRAVPERAGQSNSIRIKYTYDRDRLMTITYPNASTNLGVTYVYGTTAHRTTASSAPTVSTGRTG